jgi:hypothetical protein
MKAPSIRDDPEHWRQRAKEALRIADRLDDLVAKETMLDIARSYEQLATLAEKKAASKTSK